MKNKKLKKWSKPKVKKLGNAKTSKERQYGWWWRRIL